MRIQAQQICLHLKNVLRDAAAAAISRVFENVVYVEVRIGVHSLTKTRLRLAQTFGILFRSKNYTRYK